MNGRYQYPNFYKNNNSNDIMNKTFYNSKPHRYILNNKTTKSKISFTIKFTTGQSFSIAGYADQTFQSILDETIKKNNLEYIRNKIGMVIFEARKIELKKTLSRRKCNFNCY